MPIAEPDLDRLEGYLNAPERDDATLPLDATQGLLAAVVSAPAPIPQDRWVPAVLGEGHLFPTPEDAREVTALLAALHDDVARQLNEAEGFDFIFYGAEGEDHESISIWCEGYLMGVALAEPGWEHDTDPELLDEMLAPFLVLAEGSEEEKVLEDFRNSLADDVLANRRYWFERSIPEPVRRASPKVGRNDPCPCGSGKKFKNCCAMNG